MSCPPAGDAGHADIIHFRVAETLDGLFRERLQRSPQADAYVHYDPATASWKTLSWSDAASQVARWQTALRGEKLQPGDRVALMVGNSPEWVFFEQAALGLGLVVVPLYSNDRAENVGFILRDSGVKVLLLAVAEQWAALSVLSQELQSVRRILLLGSTPSPIDDSRVSRVADWLPDQGTALQPPSRNADGLATIVYTSGTTGRPKGVMLSHRNILWNAWSGMQHIPVYANDVFLSFLPLSHMLERTVGYYIPMMAGATVAYARSIPQLAEDLVQIRPTVLIAVPRIFERVHLKVRAQLDDKPAIARRLFELATRVGWERFLHAQGRAGAPALAALWPVLHRLVASKIQAKLGGRLRCTICGGAPLSPELARVFIGLGVPLQQGYGLTETSPVLSVNTLENNEPASVGSLLSDVEARIGANDELLVRGPGVMLGYWNDAEATRGIVDGDGWLHTGDQARIEGGHIYITGRLKEILVLSTGEKIAPHDMEEAIKADLLFEQVVVFGEARPYLTALAVLNTECWQNLATALNIDPEDRQSLDTARILDAVQSRVTRQLHAFPGYAHVRRVGLTLEPWTVENGLLTPTLKVKRHEIIERYRDVFDSLYAGH